MDRDKKKLESLRKRNDDLTSKLEEAKADFAEYQLSTAQSYEKAKELINELTDLKYQWKQALFEVQRAKLEYDRLIEDVKILKKGVNQDKWSLTILNMMGLN